MEGRPTAHARVCPQGGSRLTRSSASSACLLSWAFRSTLRDGELSGVVLGSSSGADREQAPSRSSGRGTQHRSSRGSVAEMLRPERLRQCNSPLTEPGQGDGGLRE